MSDKAILNIGGTTAAVELSEAEHAEFEQLSQLQAAANRVGIPQVSDDVRALVEHFMADDVVQWSQDVIGAAKPSDLIRACQLLAEMFDLNTLEAHATILDCGQELTEPTRLLLHWIFLARVRIRGLLPYMRSAAALSYLPPGGRFTLNRAAERVGCTHTVLMHIGARRKERLTLPMRGYIGDVQAGPSPHIVIDGSGHAFHKNMQLTPGISKLDTLLRRVERSKQSDAQKERKRRRLLKARVDSKLDETLFDEAIASRPDLENSVIMRLGLSMLMALRTFAESRKATYDLGRLALAVGCRSAEELAASPENYAGQEPRIRQLLALREKCSQYHHAPGVFDFQDFIEVHGNNALSEVPAEELVTVPGVDGKCLRNDTAQALRKAGHTVPSPLMFMEDFTDLFDRHGTPMLEGRRVLEAEVASADGPNVTWHVRLEGDDPDSPPRSMQAADFLGSQYTEFVPQVVDVVNGPQIRTDGRGPHDDELRFAHQGVAISLSPGDVNPRFAECRRKRKS